MTKLIGYKHKKGSFPNKETGEIVEYDNFDLYFITGNVPDIVGYFPSEYRVKANVIRQILAIDSKTPESDVLNILHDMINKDVMLSVLSVDDKPVVTGLMLFNPPRTVENKPNVK